MDQIKLYKKDTVGKLREWSIEVIKNADGSATIVKKSGILDGNLVSEAKTITKGKNLGKVNETSPYTQAVSDAQNAIKKQLKGDYVANMEDLREAGELGTGLKEPTSAKTYDPTLKASGSKNLEKLKKKEPNIEDEEVALQDKIDGLRGPVIINETEVKFRSRSGEVYQPIPHIAEALRRKYDELKLTGEIVLDGELYIGSSNKTITIKQGEKIMIGNVEYTPEQLILKFCKNQ